MRFLLSIIILLLLGAGIFWYMQERERNPDIQRFEERVSSDMERATTNIRENFSLDSGSIREELANTGQVIREKTRELTSDRTSPSNGPTTPDAQIRETVEQKIGRDPQLSQATISVGSSAGVVTLSGTVSSFEQIGNAMALALETEGVREVVSKLQVTQTSPTARETVTTP
jgi:osmotically-inducible protein OsmY